MPPKSKIPPNAKFQPQNPQFVSHETSGTDTNDLRLVFDVLELNILVFSSRLFVGCLNLEVCTRNDVIELFRYSCIVFIDKKNSSSMYGPITGVTFFAKGGYAFVQFETPEDAEDAVLNLNRYMFQGIRLG